MKAKKPAECKSDTPNQPIELTDDELESVCGGGPHVRVFNGNGGRG